MVLPAPNLDDRHFQDLVDDAKRLVQQRCPEWTDHNVSDPGVTLIEAFAQMVDQLIYRLNRVPDRHYVKFLELIGVELRPPAAARGKVTFWLSAPQPQTVVVRGETEVATPRTDVDDPVVFSTIQDLDIVPCSFDARRRDGGRRRGRRPHHRAARGTAIRVLPAVAAARRRAADRAVQRRAVVRGGAPDELPGPRCRRRPDGRRWSGRPGPAPAGPPASSTATRPAG